MTDLNEAMVEKVARAVTAERVRLLNEKWGRDVAPGWDEYTDEGKDDAMSEATAAIEALQVDELVAVLAEARRRFASIQIRASETMNMPTYKAVEQLPWIDDEARLAIATLDALISQHRGTNG